MPYRKPSRYEAVHRALLDRSGSLPPETSPEDLKIRTLERATAFLHAQIQEAQEYTEQLRRYLADRSTQPGEYQDYQREKWRTDRRLAALRALTESSLVAPGTIPKNSEYETTSLPARKRANLSSFFQHGSRKAPLRFNCAVTGKALERRVLKQVSPLLLKPSIPPARIHSPLAPDDLPPLYVRRKKSEKMISTASTREGLWTPSLSSYSVTEDTLMSGLSPKTPPDDNMGVTHDGTVLIHSPILRSEEEIIAEMGDITLPAYALNLLEDLDYIHDKIPLHPESSTRDRSLFLGTPSPLIVTPTDWDYPGRSFTVASPGRTAMVRIPDRHLADTLLTSAEIETIPRRRGRTQKVSLDPALFKDGTKSDKLGEVAPIRHSLHVASGEEERKPRSLLKKKSSAVFSLVTRNSGRRAETTTPTPRKNIASMVKRRMSAMGRFR
ncbi:hypothetical protein BDM02DRAFT_2481532 [Thelephora ganbajun]|uniref:Uncharacterized protein n=1 Tax=Thelephora ganbajun TaxID=370292 RepID=A0ACB6ZEW2_THEGA|nr:hypothetical protein BDM02DRAFT_2481532 [Thelephora ganbajun]